MSTVLVVEDSHSQRECISYQLTWSGLNVIQASDGVEALEKIHAKIPDLVLLDIVMPQMDGYRVCRLIKANPKTRNIPIVFLTSKGQHLVFKCGMKYAEAYVGKPWQPRELLDTIKQLLVYSKSLCGSDSANAWTEYGVLIINMIELYESRTDVWRKYSRQIIKLYEFGIAAFEQALEIEPNHLQARQYHVTIQNKWAILRGKLEQAKPCHVCRYYYGKNGLNCAVYPSGPIEKMCRDWEFK